VRRYKSYKDAKVMASKSNSKAGATAEQIMSNSTSLLVMQQKRCPNFDVFDAVFGSSPNVKPVYPTECGGGGQNSSDGEADDTILDSQDDIVSGGGVVHDPLPRPPPLPSLATAVPGGKPAAAFHLAPSKKEKKLDLGEAYLRAQQSRIESQASSAHAKTRSDMVVALSLQGKTTVEIATLLTLIGL
jgi:hypothetical protein